MHLLIHPIIKTTTSIIRATRDAILPFAEQPPGNKQNVEEKQTRDLKASDLFSCFTADIIKEEVIFTR